MIQRAAVVVLIATVILGLTYFYGVDTPLPTGMIDVPATRNRGWPLPWLAETRFTDPIGSAQSPQYEMLWQGLVVDSFLFLIIGIIASFRFGRKKKQSLE